MNGLWILTNEKHFPKTKSKWEFCYGLFTNLPRIRVTCDCPPSSFKLKRGMLPLLTKMYINLKTTCHIKLKFFLWTNLLESLLLEKYFIYVTAALSHSATREATHTYHFITNNNVPIYMWSKGNLLSHLNPIQDGRFRGCSRMGRLFGPPTLKSATHILQWWNLAQLYLT